MVDLATALVLLGMVATGLLLKYVLPPGSGGRALASLGRHDWGDVHFWMSVAIGVLVVAHVALHWQWVCVTALRLVPRPGRGGAAASPVPSAWRRNLAGGGLLVLLVAGSWGAVLLARANVKAGAGGRHHGGGGPAALRAAPAEGQPDAAEDAGIRGSMTLAEVSAASGVPLDTLRRELGLPAAAPADERLGRLSKTHGFTMQRAREVAARRDGH